jgi:uncharacterized protein (TIGR02246 family)
MRKHYLGFLVLAALPWVSTTGKSFQPPVVGGGVAAPTTASDDAEAIKKSARDFADAFNKGDAKTIAAMYTQNGESREADGRMFVGQAAIEKAYVEVFKSNIGAKVEVLVKSVRFPAKDLAIEEGILRFSRGPMPLPETTAYTALHVREGGLWKMAQTTEFGAGVDRLEDIEWLLGDWTTQAPSGAIAFSFSRDPKGQAIIGKFTRTPQGKASINGSIRVIVDPTTGQIRSSGSEDNGSYSHATWTCDGKSWILDVNGFTALGAPASERILLQRAGADVITWRAVDRVMGSADFPDTVPLRLTRAASTASSK